MKPKTIKIIALAVIALVLFLAGCFVGYSYCKSSYDAGVIEQQKEDAEVVVKHIDKKEKVEANVNDAIIVIQKIVDPTKCLDTPSPDVYLDGLRKADNETESFIN